MYLQSKIKVWGSSRGKIKLFLSKKLVKDFNIWWIILFIKYYIFHIILRIEMSVVNFKIIFVKKQKQTRERPTQGRGGDFDYNRNGRFHTSDELFGWNGLSVW